MKGILRQNSGNPQTPQSNPVERQNSGPSQGQPLPVVSPLSLSQQPGPPIQLQPVPVPVPVATPSRELLPPLLAPVVGPSSAFPPLRAPVLPQSQPISLPPPAQGQPQQTFDNIELLPPIEIPPEFPIDVPNTPGSSSNQGPIQTNEINQFNANTQQSSLLPTTGSGSGDAIRFPTEFLPPLPPAGQLGPSGSSPLVFRTLPSPPSPPTPTPTRDSGLDCLGSCDCPGDFNFVCGSNRFLYQNECALECDKRCNPDVIKVSMAQCSR